MPVSLTRWAARGSGCPPRTPTLMCSVDSLSNSGAVIIIGAGQTQGYRRTALHPLGSLDDHAYVLSDAGISSLIIDPNPMFVERALGLLEKVPSLKQILTIGPVPEALRGVALPAV